MTDFSKYRNVSLSNETYEKLIILSGEIIPDVKLSISKTIEAIASEKLKNSYNFINEVEKKKMVKIN